MGPVDSLALVSRRMIPFSSTLLKMRLLEVLYVNSDCCILLSSDCQGLCCILSDQAPQTMGSAELTIITESRGRVLAAIL